MLDEAVLCNKVLKVLHLDEVVVDGMLLAGARVAGGVRDGEAEGVWVAFEEQAVESSLADARRAGDDDGPAVRRSWRRVSAGFFCPFVLFPIDLRRDWQGCWMELTSGHCAYILDSRKLGDWAAVE